MGVSNPSPSPDLSPEAWQQRYLHQQTGWDRGVTSPALLKWLEEETLKPGHVLVPGCGNGHEVLELAQRGFTVTAVDFAKHATNALTSRLADRGLVAEVVRADILEYSPPSPVDSIYEQTCLCALAPHNWTAYEERLYDGLRIGGKLLALFMQTNAAGGPPFHCDLNAMKALFKTERWNWSEQPFTVDHPSGMHEIAVVLTKNENAKESQND